MISDIFSAKTSRRALRYSFLIETTHSTLEPRRVLAASPSPLWTVSPQGGMATSLWNCDCRRAFMTANMLAHQDGSAPGQLWEFRQSIAMDVRVFHNMNVTVLQAVDDLLPPVHVDTGSQAVCLPSMPRCADLPRLPLSQPLTNKIDRA
jgi:hypothetical protein